MCGGAEGLFKLQKILGAGYRSHTDPLFAFGTELLGIRKHNADLFPYSDVLTKFFQKAFGSNSWVVLKPENQIFTMCIK